MNILAGVHYPAKEDFINAIHNFIGQANEGRHDDEINDLMTLKS